MLYIYIHVHVPVEPSRGAKAIAMAMFDSVTVSMGLETMGVFRGILRDERTDI